MSEPGIIQVATLVVGAIVTIMLAVIQRDQRKARKEAQDVKETLIVSNGIRDAKQDTIHDLVSSQLGKELQEKTDALKELAKIDPLKWQMKASEASRQLEDFKRQKQLADDNEARRKLFLKE